MRALWITNILFPEATLLLTGNSELKSSGGWLLGAANGLLRSNEVQLMIAAVSPFVTNLTYLKGKSIDYYIIPLGKGNTFENPEYEKYWIDIKKAYQPDIVHIHGTEYSHGLSYLKVCENDNVIISIQGLISECHKYYNANIRTSEVIKNLSLIDLILRKVVFLEGKKDYRCRAEVERKIIANAHHVIGRTSWDQAHAWAINPNAKYHFCNETLRNEFYDGSKWDYKKCIPHTIFLSQSTTPLKGLHLLLDAMSLILQHYPDTQIRIAGDDITKTRPILGTDGLSGYGKILKNLIIRKRLNHHISFLGSLNAEEMKSEYLQSNVFICPSSIENSPNSLGEAQILGVPHLCSYVGGTMDMMKGNEAGLYRFDDPQALAYKVCRIFASADKQTDMSKVAMKRHDPETNQQRLLTIYNEILK